MTKEEHLQQANFRLERHNGEYNIYVEDKTIGYFYLVASHIKTFERAIELCQEYLTPKDYEKEQH